MNSMHFKDYYLALKTWVLFILFQQLCMTMHCAIHPYESTSVKTQFLHVPSKAKSFLMFFFKTRINDCVILILKSPTKVIATRCLLRRLGHFFYYEVVYIRRQCSLWTTEFPTRYV